MILAKLLILWYVIIILVMSVKMTKRQEEENITLMNSQCSSGYGEADNTLFRAVTRSLGDDHCNVHNQKFQYYYNKQLLCSQCFHKMIACHHPPLNQENRAKLSTLYHLSFILNHPILLLIEQTELISHPLQTMELVLNAYKPLFAKNSDFKLQKQLLVSFISRMKSRIDVLCDQLLDSFQEIEANMGRQMDLKEEIRSMNKMYEDQFIELLGDKYETGKRQQLEEVLKEYSDNNWSPFSKMMENCMEMMKQLQDNPYIDWKALTDLYTVITDETLWKNKKIVSSYSQSMKVKLQTAQMILPNQQILLQGQYSLDYTQDGLTLNMQNRSLGHLQAEIDSLYHLSKYRLLAISYQKLQIINYFDQLTVQEEYPISGCTDILPFDDYLIVISKDRLISIDLQDKTYEILGIDYKDLRYFKDSPDYFECTNKERARVRWNLKKQRVVATHP